MRRTAAGVKQGTAYRQMLVDKREEVRAALGIQFDSLARMGRVAEDDQAQISHDEFVALERNSIEYTQLRLIEDALQRIDSGSYGNCLACEEPLPEKRLRAIPWARYCIPCQEEAAHGFDPDREMVEGN